MKLKSKPAVPVVFAFSGDPVVAGIAESLARPGGNATGMTFMSIELNAKRIDLIRIALPQCRKVSLLSNRRHPGEAREFENDGAEMRNRIVARAKSIAEQLSAPPPEPLRFDTNGVATVTGWRVKKDADALVLDQPTVDGKRTLHLNADSGGGVASCELKVDTEFWTGL